MPKLLLADDESDNLHLLAQLLELEGYEVNVAGDGVEACEKAQTWRPDLIIMDGLMPRRDGLEATRLLKTDPQTQSIPVLFMSSWTGSEDRQKAIAAGADDFIARPPAIAELRSKIQSLLGAKKLV